ncbi:MAG: transcriptional regulator [Nitrosopumilus sp.]|nr:transcriptional regulator [Nitrosopumilus sp.]MDH3384952.1 transcriptional regulator [Nitrosopumilus sp.]
MRKPQRSRLEIYNDVLSAIQNATGNGEVKPTRVQQLCNMSYDKFSKILGELKKNNLICYSPLKITKKGQKFLQDYSKIKNFTRKMEIEFLRETKEIVS